MYSLIETEKRWHAHHTDSAWDRPIRFRCILSCLLFSTSLHCFRRTVFVEGFTQLLLTSISIIPGSLYRFDKPSRITATRICAALSLKAPLQASECSRSSYDAQCQ